jgi:copper transport protein
VTRFFLVLLLFATEAGAHADLVSSSPADGASLASPPSVIELRFNEPVRPIAVRLLDQSGKPVPLSAPQAEGAVLRIALPDKLGEGHYILSFRVASLDSHPVGGSIVFGVGAAAPSHVSHAAEKQDLVRILLRAVRDLALLIAAGGALFSLLLRGFPRDREIVRWNALAGAAASALGIGVHGAALLGEWHETAWSTGLHSSFGVSACVAIAGLLAIASLRPWLMIAGAVVALSSLPLTGHALIAHPAWVAVIALAAHALAAAFWAGSLAGLFFILARQPLRGAAALRRFSPMGMVAVALLLAAGVTLAVLQLQTPLDLTTSAYGRFIVAKAVLFVLLILLALTNRYRLLPLLERGSGERTLRRSIAAEFILITSVVTLTAFLVQTPPPERVYEHTLASGARTATLSVAPGRTGSNVISVRVADAEEVSIEMKNAAAGIEPIVRPMQRVAPDRYRYEGSELAFPGAWDLSLHVRIGEFDKVAFNARVWVR